MMMMIIIIITITAIIIIIIIIISNSYIEVLSNCDQAIRGNRYKIKNKKQNSSEYY